MNSSVTGSSTSNSVDPMQIYGVVVAARNNVEEARNGPSVKMRGKKYKLFHFFSIIKYVYFPSFFFFLFNFQKSS